ncbi:MAG: hypothetical protein ACLQUZ_07650 [Rhizomicrobium sp.]
MTGRPFSVRSAAIEALLTLPTAGSYGVPPAVGAPPKAVLAQQDDQKLNPTNDPDVQRGIIRERIDYCVRQREAGMTPEQIRQHDVSIRYYCTNAGSVGAVRG